MTSKASKLRLKRKQRVCSIPGCGNNHKAKGLCAKHHQRQLSHGDPLVTRTGAPPRGVAKRFYEEVILVDERDDCITWPYGRSIDGYATMTRGGKKWYVSRFLCEDVYGPPPTPDHQAAHSCGNGHLACVNRRHLSWKTPTENCQDKFVHGTHSRGERSGTAKLTEEDVIEILALRGTATRAAIGERFGVSGATIFDIHAGKTWAWLSRPRAQEAA